MTPDNANSPTPDWQPDILGANYTQTFIELGKDPDGEDRIRACLVRYRPDDSAPADTEPLQPFADRTAVLWVHGMSDYFFQTHVAKRYHEEGYAFYALDLRKCGRAHLPGQTWHSVSDLSLYDVELGRALDFIRAEGHVRVTVNAHSTGGLVCALWLDRMRKDAESGAGANIEIDSAVFNSPWLDLHVSPAKAPVYRTLARVLSKVRPQALLPGVSQGGYGMSISDEHYGSWSYNTKWKPIFGHDKNWSWFWAILEGQRRIRKGVDTGVPTLVLHSDASAIGGEYSTALDRVDAVLDTRQIANRTRNLGRYARAVEIPGARHDVYLSEPDALERAFAETFAFISATEPVATDKESHR